MKNILSEENKRFNYLFGETEAVYHELALKFDLSDSALQILYALCDGDGSCLLRDICHASGLSKQTINSAIRKLEKENIIALDSNNRKFKTVKLTDEGHKLAEQTAMRIIRMENEIISSWSKEDVENYLRLTEKYLRDLKEKSQIL